MPLRCVILYRVNGGPVQAVGNSDDGEPVIEEFASREEAIDFAEDNGLFQSGQADYQIVELDEL